MERSSELKDLMLRFYEAVSTGDLAFMNRMLSSQHEVLLVGTDPSEWWTDPATVTQTLKAQAQAGIKAVPGELLAYREGTVGWVADRAKFVLPDGTEAPFRWTGVFHQEGGEWKLIQGHASVGVPNQEALGLDIKA
jgi:ketosteroid isomerase-like protein